MISTRHIAPLFCCLAAGPLGSLRASLVEWQAAVESGTAPASRYFKDVDGPAPSGLYPVGWDVGALTGDRSFEFIVFAGETGGSSALMGVSGVQGLKFEQWMDTGNLGLTDFGVADHVAPVPSPFYAETHLVYAFDGADTHLYVNGALAHTFSGVPLDGAGMQYLGAVSADGVAFGDPLDGRILGFASYDTALPAAEVAAHHAAFSQGATVISLPAWQAAVAAGTAPAVTQFTPVSGLAPLVIDLGPLTSGGEATYEFLVHAGAGGASSALAGRGGAGGQGMKFEQWNNTGVFGLTNFGVVDINADVPSTFDAPTHVAYVSDGVSTSLYINGEPLHLFDGVPMMLADNSALAAAASITEVPDGATFRDPLDGSVLRFASYDEAMDPAEITSHYAAFAADGGAGSFSAWQSAVTSGLPAVATRLDPAAAGDQVTFDIGALSGARTFEFVVNAGDAAASGSLMGDGVQSLRFEQWNNTGALGLTVYGVADHVSSAIPPVLTDTHIVFTSDGTNTSLYLDGQLVWELAGVPLTGSGIQGLATSAVVTTGGTVVSYFDRLDGHVLGFAAYETALGQIELKAHADAFLSAARNPELRITEFSRNSATGALTLTWTSLAGQLYDIYYSTNLAAIDQLAAAAVPAAAGPTTTHTIAAPAPGAPQVFLRVRQK